jgi:hypothetical protein
MKILFILVGVLFAALGAYFTRKQLLLRRNGQRVTGTVTSIDRQWDSGGGADGSPGGYVYYPVLSFQTLAGQQIETRSGVGASNPHVEAGQQVRVLYDPANPSTAEVDNFYTQSAAFLLGLLCAAFGTGVAVVFIVSMISS